MTQNQLTAKQAARVTAAPTSRKKALRASYLAQNARAAAAAAAPPASQLPIPMLGQAAAAAQQGKQQTRSRKARAQPAAVQSGNHKHSLDIMNPLNPMPAPRVVSDGKALSYTGLVSGDFTVGPGKTTLLVVTNTGESGSVGALLHVNADGTVDTVTRELFTIPALATEDALGGASSLSAQKFSVSVVNCSNALKRAGRVTYINSSQRLPARYLYGGADDYSTIIDGIKNSPYRRRISADSLVAAKQLVGFTCDTVAYNSFARNRGTLNFEQFFAYVFGADLSETGSAGLNPKPRPMSTVAYVFDPVSEVQDYTVTIRATFYTRWPLSTVQGQSMHAMPTAPAHVINGFRDHAEETGSDLAHVMEGAMMATMAPRVAGAARNAGGAVLAGMRNALGLGGAEAAEAGAAEFGAAELMPLLMAAA